MVTAPFWDPPPEKYPGRLPAKADVVVIGGGIAGVSLLYHLAQRRIDAVLVERSRIAAGASGRNAGFLLAGVATNYAEAVRLYGREKARDVWELTNENHDRMIEAVKGQNVGYRRLGSIVLPDSAKNKPQQGKVLAIGDGRMLKDGSRRGLQVKVGDDPILDAQRVLAVRAAVGSEIVMFADANCGFSLSSARRFRR